jgi:hypothetical protein
VLHVGEVEVRLPWELDGQFDTGADDEGEDEDEGGVVDENRERLKVRLADEMQLVVGWACSETDSSAWDPRRRLT